MSDRWDRIERINPLGDHEPVVLDPRSGAGWSGQARLRAEAQEEARLSRLLGITMAEAAALLRDQVTR